jgi:hypothetical protein
LTPNGGSGIKGHTPQLDHNMSNRGDELLGDELWLGARADYENPKTNLKALAERLNTGVHGLVQFAKRQGWKMRGGTKAKAKAEGTRQTIARLKELLQKRLGQLEGQLDAIEAEVSAISNERDIRAMNTLVRTLEKVLELERKDRSIRQRKTKERRKFDDAERDELSSRIKALCREQHGNRTGADAGPERDSGDIEGLAPLGPTEPAAAAE